MRNRTIQERSSVPVYVYAETVYDGGIYKGAVEGLKRNGSGWVTIGKLLSRQNLPLEQVTDKDGKNMAQLRRGQ